MYTLSFPAISLHDKPLVGGKGYALAELSRLPISVPSGFVVTTTAYEEFMKFNGISPTDGDAESRIRRGRVPDEMSRAIRAKLSALQSRFVAVRSSSLSEDSAERSFAGIFESFLNVPHADVLEKVKDCFASALSTRARHYSRNRESIAVVVQTMIDSEYSGVLFTKNPLTGDEEELVIETCEGLGEPVVSGAITPGAYVVNKRTGAVLMHRAGKQSKKLIREGERNVLVDAKDADPALGPSQLQGLVRVAGIIERYYQFPCDIEWCFDREIHILQSRPITAVAGARSRRVEDADAPRPLYNKRFCSRILSPVFEEANIQGYRTLAQEQFELPMSLAGYHLYQPSVQHPRGEVDIWIHADLDRQLIMTLKQKLSDERNYVARLEARYCRTVREFEAFCERALAENFDGVPRELLLARLEQLDALNRRMTTIYNAPIFMLIALGEVLYSKMRKRCPDSTDEDFMTLSFTGIESSSTLQAEELMHVVVEAQRASSRGVWSEAVTQTLEVSTALSAYHKRWMFLACTDVIGEAFSLEHFVQKLKESFHVDTSEFARQLAVRRQRDAQVVEAAAARYEALREEITWLRRWQYHRNNTTEDYYRCFQYLKPLFLEISRRLSLTYRRLLALSIPEMDQALRGDLPRYAQEIEARLTEGFTLEQRRSDVLLRAGVEEIERLERHISPQSILQGQIACTGRVKGVVKVIRDPVEEASKLADGDILVTAMTSPSYIPLMQRSSGIVTDEGGILCHAALVSREMGKPCIVGASNATQILMDGDVIMLDAENGFVELIDRNARAR